ncbi:hypothetical protein P9239_02775 [Caballeronia sp. LZ062]|uniref:hypothetical protein n=1 Tax=unclassified Caballeronia TaxID=2646786 RepID=UPI002859E7B8|nr:MULTISPECIES: hypothetical protein [unclassified Caballeronia]MDR5857734.1 hypothetical protein [Caballeronia sp. LZ050]MDR5869284.1 hypothetical protein [Caballeronia sp. LZ062]
MTLLCASATTSFADEMEHAHHRHNLHVFDANGQEVGALKYAQGSAGVFVTVNGAPAFVPIMRRQISGTGNKTVYSATEFMWGWYFQNQYYSSDCSGAPLVPGTAAGRPAFTLRKGSDVTVYVAPETNSQLLTVSSYTLGTNGQCQRYTPPLTAAGWPVESSCVITQEHPEPLSIHY